MFALIFLNGVELNAQNKLYDNVSVQLERVDWVGLNCADGTDIGLGCVSIAGGPDPRFRYQVAGGSFRYIGNSVGPTNGIALDNQSETDGRNIGGATYLTSFTNVCRDGISIYMQAWEEDQSVAGVALCPESVDYTYDASLVGGCVGTADDLSGFGDDFQANTTNNYDLPSGGNLGDAASSGTRTVSFGNYSMRFRYTWDKLNAPIISPASPEACIGATIQLTSTAPKYGANNIEWFTDQNDPSGSSLGFGTTINVVVPSVPFTLYAAEENSNCYGVFRQITINQAPAPNQPTAAGAQTCLGGSVTLSASSTSPGANFIWYDANPNTTGVLVGTGPDYTTPPINLPSEDWWVIATYGVGCESAPTQVTVTTDLPLIAPNASSVTICEGYQVDLSASSGGANSGFFNWYSDAGLTNLLYVGNPYTTPNLSSSTTYYVTEDIDDCVTPATAVVVTVTPSPGVPDPDQDTVYTIIGGTATYSVSAPLGPNQVYRWYAENPLLGGPILFEGSTWTSPPINVPIEDFFVIIADTTVDCSVGNLKLDGSGSRVINSGSARVVAVAASLIAPPVTVNDTICSGSTATLSATADSAGAVIVWFSSGSPVDSIATGDTYTTPVLVQNTTYYAGEYINGELVSELAAVTAVIHPKPTPPEFEVQDYVCEGVVFPSFYFNDEQIGDTWNVILIQTSTGDTIGTVSGTITELSNDFFTNLTPGIYVLVGTVTDATTGCESDVSIATFTVVNLPSIPIVNGDTEICEGESSILTAPGTGNGTITWYSDAGLTNILSTGSQYYTGALTADVTYYVTEQNDSAQSCEGAAAQVDITVNALPGTPTTTNDTICQGDVATLAASGSGGTLIWFSDASGIDSIGTGATFTTGALYQTTTYYVAEESVGGCLGGLAAVTAYVNPKPTPVNAPTQVTQCTFQPVIVNFLDEQLGSFLHFIAIEDATGDTVANFIDPIFALSQDIVGFFIAADEQTLVLSVIDPVTGCESDVTIMNVSVIDPPPAPTVNGDTVICASESTVLTAAGTGGLITWYGDAGLTQVISTGGQLNTGALYQDTTFYVTETNIDVTTCESEATLVNITVNSLPAGPTVTNDTICEGETATLLASGSGGTLIWYSDPSGIDSVGTGDTYETPVLTHTTIYYVAEVNTSGCEGGFTPVTAVVNTKPTPPNMLAELVICEFTDAPSFTVSDEQIGFEHHWILINTGTGDTIVDQDGFIITEIETPYYSSIEAGQYVWIVSIINPTTGCESDPSIMSLTVSPIPDAPTVLDTVEICSGETATLFAYGQVANPNSVITWYDNPNFDPLAFGWEYETQPLTADKTFYATITNEDGCESEPSVIVVIVNELPADPVGTNDTICQWTSATLTATGNGGLLTWYSDGAGTNVVGTGSSYPTPVLAQTTVFYVGETNTTTGCESSLVGVTAVVIPGPDAPQAANITLCVDEVGEITATGSGTGSLIWYDANQVQIEVDAMPPATGSLTVGPFATAGTYFFYVSENDGNCESQLEEIEVVVGEALFAPVAEGDTICEGETATITAIGTGGVINWYADGALTIPLSSGSQYTTDVLTATTSFWATESFGSCEGPAVEVEVVVDPLPATPTATSNAPICEGETLTLFASSVVGATYEWTGPNGFTSNLQNPTIDNVTEANNQGIYSVVVTSNSSGCQSGTATVYVEIVPIPDAPSIASNSPLCEGEDLVLTASVVAGATYTWYDDSNNVITTTADNSLTIPAVSLADAGTYGVSVNVGGCESPTNTTVVVVKARPDAPAVSNNGPICEYEDLVLIAQIVSGATYTWTGPNGPISQNGPIITISEASVDDAGTYGVFITVNGCSSDSATTEVEITAAPVLPQNPTTNSPVCEHDWLILQAPYNEDLTYDWTGPNGYVADTTYIDTVNNFYVEAIFDANENDDQGFYTLVVTDVNTGCESKPYPVLVIINKFPDNVIADNNGPACEGDNVQLTVTSIVNATYTWTGPLNYVSYEQNPVLENVTPDMSGTYEVTIMLGGCTSMTVSTDVLIRANPIADAGVDLYIEEGTVFQLDGNGSIGAIDFAWLGEDQSWFDNPTSPNPWIGLNGPLPARDEPYVFVLTVYNEFGCTDVDTVLVFVYETTDLIIPNIITPNGDGVNDTWVVQYLDNLDNYVLSIYARGGTLVYKTTAYNNDWDGTMDGDDLPEGTYWYTIRSDDELVFKGYIEIIR
ncbi:MAG: gliding motility-associated C-terminal domain-containing protein [Chitinophagales bacterium]